MKKYLFLALCVVVCCGRSVFCMEPGDAHEEKSVEDLLRDAATLRELFGETKELVEAQEGDLAVLESRIDVAQRSSERAIHSLEERRLARFCLVNKHWKQEISTVLGVDWGSSCDNIVWTRADQRVWKAYWDVLEQLVISNAHITPAIAPVINHIIKKLRTLARIAKLDNFDAQVVVDSLFSGKEE